MWWLNLCALNIEVDVFLRDGPSGSVASNYINLEIFTTIFLIIRRYPTPRSPPRPAPHATCSLTEPSPSTSATGMLTSSIGACPGSPHTNFIGAALTLFDRHRAVFISSHFRRSAPHGAPNPAASARAHRGRDWRSIFCEVWVFEHVGSNVTGSGMNILVSWSILSTFSLLEFVFILFTLQNPIYMPL